MREGGRKKAEKAARAAEDGEGETDDRQEMDTDGHSKGTQKTLERQAQVAEAENRWMGREQGLERECGRRINGGWRTLEDLI